MISSLWFNTTDPRFNASELKVWSISPENCSGICYYFKNKNKVYRNLFRELQEHAPLFSNTDSMKNPVGFYPRSSKTIFH
jgi:threonyl-tRNA synthetase